MFAKDTPVPTEAGLSHIVVKWKHPSAKDECHTLYDAVDLGSTAAKQRAATRVSIVKANGSEITRYRAYYKDGTVEDMS